MMLVIKATNMKNNHLHFPPPSFSAFVNNHNWYLCRDENNKMEKTFSSLKPLVDVDGRSKVLFDVDRASS
jgi:hypothetical protein